MKLWSEARQLFAKASRKRSDILHPQNERDGDEEVRLHDSDENDRSENTGKGRKRHPHR